MSASLLPLSIENADVDINRQTLLKGINLTVTKEPLSIVLGANGAGKTLLLKLCSGLLQTSRGQLHWNRSIQISKGSLPALSLVFQKPVLLKRSVADNIKFALKGLSRNKIESQTASALQWAEIESLADQQANTLSGGQQQLVAIARAWATQPEVLLLDEPTANLDSVSAEHLMDLFVELNEKHKITFVIATHDQRVMNHARRLIHMVDGKIVSDEHSD